ncbi:hypothetical protein HYH03_017740 [Edaphochlamys debaryana]|uniref:Uncharacterized protein n=1 Tax=Edaphochlamys debaryana TaxID=47281 RepID=A0A836BQ98_9CHLO|nr:hypothetical protein HYH03_017740 [Edaphochlamys debaryana]|eukprot:KAG2483388.1 hypothetical protein HYH03_017740 [Edaphochlamys debaryana]
MYRLVRAWTREDGCRGNADQSYTEQVPDTGLALEHRLTGFEARLGASGLEALASVYDGGQQRSQQVALEPLDDGPARPRYANVSFSETSTVFAVTVCCAAGGADSGGGAVQVQGLKFEVEESGAWQRLQLGERCDRSAGNYGVDVQQERLAGIAVRTVGEGPTARVVAVALVTVDLPRPPPPPPFTVWSDVTAPPLSWELHLPPPMDDLAAPPDAPEGADGEAPLPPPPHLVAEPTEPPSAEARPPPASPSPGASTWAPPPQLPRAVAVAVSAGHFHTCALTDSGTVLCWGTNRFGQLGYAADPNAYGIPPRPLPLTAAAVGVAASGDNTCALLAGGSVQCFGAEAEGQLFELRLPPGERVASVALSRLTLEDGAGLCALLQPSGRVVCRDAYDPDPPVNAALARLGPASRLAGSTLFLCGVFSSSLFCWRYSPIQRAFTEPQLLNLGSLDVADVALNFLYGCVIVRQGRVKCFGSNVYGQLGYGDTLLRSPTAPGTVFADVDLGPGLRAVALSLGDAHSCALCSTDAADGSEAMVVKCWGRNSDGRLGLGDNATRGDRPGTMGAALPSVDLGPGRSPVAIAAGSWHTCALTQPGGQMLCWGDNLSRQLPGVTGESVGMRPEDMGSGLRAIDLGAWPSALPPTPAAGAKPPLPPQPQPAAPREPPEHRSVFILNKKEVRLRCWATGGTGADASLLEVLVGQDLLPRLNATGVDLKPRDPSYPLVMLDEQQRPAIPSDAPDLGLTFRDMARLHLLDSSVMGVPLGPGGPLVQCLNCIEVVFTNCTFGLLSGQVPAWRRGVGGSGSPPRYLDGASVPELLRDASSSAIVNGSVLTYFYPSYVVHGPVHLSGLRRASFRRLQCHDVYNAHGGARMSRNFAREDGGAAFCGGTADVSLDSAAAMEGNLAAPGSGGAVSAARCRLRMAGGAALEGNAAGKHGGGLHCGQLDGDLELASGARMEGNSAAGDGGALFLASSGRLVASAAVIRRNRAGQRGGVVFSASDLDLDLTAGSTVEHNAANRTGGVAFAQGSISRLALAGGSVVLNNTARWGGAISCEGDAGSIAVSSSSRISSNAATHGAGGAMWFGSSLGTLVINGSSSLSNNSAASEGGAMWVAGTTDSIVVAGNSSVSGNTARKGSGGAITVLEALGTLQLLGSEARGNGAATSGGFLNAPGGVGLLYILYGSVVAGNTGSDGGAVFASSIGQFAANGSSLVGNVARGEGGALYVSGSVSALTFGPGALLEGNRAEAGGGGATFVAGSTDLVSAQGARVLANSAATEGGAFRLAHVARMVLDNTTFTANTAHSSGGGAVRVDSAGQLDLIGCLLSDNAAATDGGFAAIATAASVTVTASVLRNNSAGMDGGALFLGGLGGPLAIRASRLEHNTAGALGGAVFTASALAVSGAAFVGNEAREGGALYALLHPGAAPAAVSSSKSATVGAVPLNLAVGQNVCPADVPMPTACGAPAAHPGEVVCSCFEGNVAAQAGGAIGGSVAATADGAGAAAGNSSSRFRVVSSVFVTNHAGALGGAVSLASSGPVPAAPLELLLDGSSARGNGVGGSGSAEGCGGAVHVAGGGRALRITGASELTQNRAGYGGAVCALGAARVVVEDSTISANRAEAGGGCFVDGGGGDGTTTITASAAPSGSRTLFLAANTSLSGNRAVLSSSSSTLRFSGHGGALLLLGSTAAALAAVDMAASAADVAGAGVASLQNMRSCVASSGGAAAAIQQAGGISREAAAEVQVASAGQGWGSGEAIRALQAAAEAQCWLLAVRLRQSGLPDAKLASTALGPSRLSERLIWMDDPRAESLAISCAPAQGSASQAGEDDAADTAALVREALASPGTLGRNSSSEERRQPLLLGCGTDSGATPTWAGAAEGSVLSDILALPPSRLQLTVDGRVVSEPAQAPLVWRPGAPGRLSAMLVDDWGRPVREHAPATLGLRLGPDAWAALQLAPQEPALAAGVGEWSSVIATGWTGSGYTLTLPPLVLPLSLSACRLGEELALGAGEDPGAQAAGSTCRACRPQQFTLWRDPRSEREPPRPPASAVNDSGAAGGGGGGGWASALAAESGCLLCPANAFCPGGAVVVPRQGFWASSPMSTQVHRCLNPDACDPTAEGLAPWLAEAAARIEAAQPIDAEVGGALAACKQAWHASAPPGAAALANLTTAAGAGNSPNASLCLLDGVPYDSAQSYMQRQCAEGYGGPLCAVCAPSHYLTPDSECARCPSVGATAALVAVACAASTALILGSVWSALAEDYTRGEEGARPEAVDVVKVLVVHIQYLVIITRLSLGWPAPIGRLQALLGAVTGAGDLLAFSPACLAPAGAGEAGRVRAQVLGALALPLAAAGLALLLWAVRYRLWNQAVLRRQGKPLSRRRRDSDGGAEADVLAEDEDVPRIKRGAEAAMFSKGYPGEKEPAADLSDAGTGGPPEEPDGSDSKAAADEGKGMVPSGPEPVGDSAGGGGGPGSRALVRRVRRLVSRLQLALTPQSSIVHLDQAMPLRRQLLVVGLMSAFILYPALVQVSLSMFACRTLDSGEGPYADLQRATWSYGYWVRYMQLEFYTGPHLQQYVPLGVACVLLFCALPPAALFALLWRQQHRLDEQRTKLQYGFAYRRYRPRWFMFECVLQLETLALVLADVFTRTLQAHQQASGRALLLLAVLLLIGVVNISANPLRMRLLTLMEFLSLMALCLTLTLGLYFVPTGSEDSGLSSQAAEDAVGILILILNAALMAAFVALLVKPGLGRAWTRHCGSLAELCGRLAASGQGACGACDWRRCWWAPGTAAGEEQESGAEAVQAAAEAAGEGEAEWGCDADGREDATADADLLWGSAPE